MLDCRATKGAVSQRSPTHASRTGTDYNHEGRRRIPGQRSAAGSHTRFAVYSVVGVGGVLNRAFGR